MPSTTGRSRHGEEGTGVRARARTPTTTGWASSAGSSSTAPRVRDDDRRRRRRRHGRPLRRLKQSRTWWRIGPGDEDVPHPDPAGALRGAAAGRARNHGHGHQNEAAFYILEGAGYEIHDDQRYDWKKGDLVFVHTDSVHRHFNPYDEKAVALVIKAKCTWMFMGLIQQGRSGPIERADEFGPREDWSAIWTPGVLDRKKIVAAEDTRLGGHAAGPGAGADQPGDRPRAASSAWTSSS